MNIEDEPQWMTDARVAVWQICSVDMDGRQPTIPELAEALDVIGRPYPPELIEALARLAEVPMVAHLAGKHDQRTHGRGGKAVAAGQGLPGWAGGAGAKWPAGSPESERVRDRVEGIMGRFGIGAPSSTNPNTIARERTAEWAAGGAVTPKAAALIERTAVRMDKDMQAMGVGDLDRAKMQTLVVDHLAMQEYEAFGRTLSDHGVRHLVQDAELANRLQGAIQRSPVTAEDRVRNLLTATMHDTGYLSGVPAGADGDHPKWSTEYMRNSGISDEVGRVFGKGMADDIERIASSHADTQIVFDRPKETAFRLADNLNLFHKEKLPAVLNEVPGSTGAMLRLAQKKATVEEARATIHGLIDDNKAKLPAPLRERLHNAADEIAPISPKFMLPVVGTRTTSVTRQGEEVVVKVQRTKANEGLAAVTDMGARQFTKLAEDYGKDPHDWANDGGRLVLGTPRERGGQGRVVIEMDGRAPQEITRDGQLIFAAPILAHLPGKHDQRSHGRVRASAGEKTLIGAARGGGFTYDPRSQSQPTSGYAVASPGHSRVLRDFSKQPDDKVMRSFRSYVRDNADALAADPELHLGGWHDTSDDTFWLDLTQVLPATPKGRKEAIKRGVERNERAIADLDAITRGDWDNAFVDTGGTGNPSTLSATLGGDEHDTFEDDDRGWDRPGRPGRPGAPRAGDRPAGDGAVHRGEGPSAEEAEGAEAPEAFLEPLLAHPGHPDQKVHAGRRGGAAPPVPKARTGGPEGGVPRAPGRWEDRPTQLRDIEGMLSIDEDGNTVLRAPDRALRTPNWAPEGWEGGNPAELDPAFGGFGERIETTNRLGRRIAVEVYEVEHDDMDVPELHRAIDRFKGLTEDYPGVDRNYKRFVGRDAKTDEPIYEEQTQLSTMRLVKLDGTGARGMAFIGGRQIMVENALVRRSQEKARQPTWEDRALQNDTGKPWSMTTENGGDLHATINHEWGHAAMDTDGPVPKDVTARYSVARYGAESAAKRKIEEVPQPAASIRSGIYNHVVPAADRPSHYAGDMAEELIAESFADWSIYGDGAAAGSKTTASIYGWPAPAKPKKKG